MIFEPVAEYWKEDYSSVLASRTRSKFNYEKLSPVNASRQKKKRKPITEKFRDLAGSLLGIVIKLFLNQFDWNELFFYF